MYNKILLIHRIGQLMTPIYTMKCNQLMTLVSLGVELFFESVMEFELELKSNFSEKDSSKDISSGVVGGLFEDPKAYPSVRLYNLFKSEACGVFETQGSAKNILAVILFVGSFVSNLPTRFLASLDMPSLFQRC